MGADTPDDATGRPRVNTDDEEFADAYRQHYGRILRLCRDRVESVAVAEELTQETFSRLLTKLPTIRDRERVGAWLAAVAANLCADHHRRRRRHTETPLDAGLAAQLRDETPEGDVAGAFADRDAVRGILQGLGRKDAFLLHAFHLEDRSLSDIARHQNSTPGSVKVRLHRARARGRAVARTRGFGGIIPAPLLRWLRGLLELAPPPAAAAAAVLPLVVIAAVALPWGATTTPPQRERATTAGANDTTQDTSPGRTATGGAPAARLPPVDAEDRGRQSTGALAAAPPAATAPAAAAAPPPAAVRIAPVAVPASGRQLSSEPVGPARRDVGVDLESSHGIPLQASVSSHGDEETDAAHEGACGVARLAPPPVYCTP